VKKEEFKWYIDYIGGKVGNIGNSAFNASNG